MSFDPVAILTQRAAAAIAAAFPALDPAAIDPMVTPSRNPKFGDFQCNAAMSLAKTQGMPPRDAAKAILAKLDLTDIAEPLTEASIAGPGFINIMLKPAALAGLLSNLETGNLGLPASGSANATVVVDLCGVNLAKQMHVGHIRSTVIGDTLARILARAGFTVIRQNHVGDWGLPIAMVTARLIDAAAQGTLDLKSITLDDLDKAYRAAQRECEADARGLAAAQRWHMGPKALAELEAQVSGAQEKEACAKVILRQLQSQDPEVVAVWRLISDVTMTACLAICKRLNSIVLPEHSAGESSYADALAPLVAELEKSGVAEASDGALIIRLDDVGIPEPLLVRKRDGAYLYATTDLAAIRHRVQKLGASRVVYCVDVRQGLHFRQVFAGARKAGLSRSTHGDFATLEHAAFGAILGEDNKPYKTRSGENVRLSDFLDQAEAHALAQVNTLSPDMPDAERREVARVVAIAAIRYSDMAIERTKDYVFKMERMVSFEGNTGPYLLYALARVRKIFVNAAEKGHVPAEPAELAAMLDAAPLDVSHAAEKGLSLALLRYPGVVHDAARTLEPSRVCAYLYELAGAFSSFYDACHVVGAETDAIRLSRLRLCRVVEHVLADGLTLLGIPTLQRM